MKAKMSKLIPLGIKAMKVVDQKIPLDVDSVLCDYKRLTIQALNKRKVSVLELEHDYVYDTLMILIRVSMALALVTNAWLKMSLTSLLRSSHRLW